MRIVMMTGDGAARVEQVVRSAWERQLLVTSVEHGAVAAALALGGLSLLLLLGTEVLSGFWLLALFAIGLVIAVIQTRRHLVNRYRAAQLLDRRLQLADSISTGWYLLAEKRDDAVAHIQMQAAESAARRANVAQAFPFAGGRWWWLSGALALLAGGLFSARYFTMEDFSLAPSILPPGMTEVWEHSHGDPDTARHPLAPGERGSDERGKKDAHRADGSKDAKRDEAKTAQPPPLAKPNGDGGNGQNSPQSSELAQGKDGLNNAPDKAAGKGGAAKEQQAGGESAGEKGDPSQSKQPSAEERANAPQSSNGLIDRMKDALQSMAAKMKPSGSGQKQDQKDQHSANDQKGDAEGSPNKEKDGQANQKDAQASQASEQQQATEGQAQGEAKQQGKSGQGKSSSPSGEKMKADAHSGAGSQDGDKAAKEAEQLKAMGKLAEILGKRSANASGDMMVENTAGKQQLRTQYSRQQGKHSDSGGEINRDDVPLAYQQYVREYMTQIRQQTAGRAHKKK